MIATSPTLGTSRRGTITMGLPVGESCRETTSKSTRNRTLGTEL